MPRVGLLAVTVVGVATACGTTFPSPINGNGVTADQLRRHPEAALVYPVSHDVTVSLRAEIDRGTFEPIDPSPATATIGFVTADRPDAVVAWYDAWLSPRGWLDADQQGDGSRSWVRGRAEDFVLDCSYVNPSGERACTADYVLRSSRFKPPHPAAPPLDDPVSMAAVAGRHVGLAATESRVQYLSGPPIPADGTAGANAARSRWPELPCCASPVMLEDTSSAEAPGATRSAYHAVRLEVAEYNRPDVPGGAFGSIQRTELKNLVDSGFLLANVGIEGINGQTANVYVYERGLREAVIFSVTYGRSMTAAAGIAYRVATVRIVYDVAPASCELSRADCFDVLAGTANIVWSHA